MNLIPYGYSNDRWVSPTIQGAEPLPNAEQDEISQTTEITDSYGLLLHVQKDPRSCALRLYADADPDGHHIHKCYSTRATAAMFTRC